jgi:hypothetical protein
VRRPDLSYARACSPQHRSRVDDRLNYAAVDCCCVTGGGGGGGFCTAGGCLTIVWKTSSCSRTQKGRVLLSCRRVECDDLSRQARDKHEENCNDRKGSCFLPHRCGCEDRNGNQRSCVKETQFLLCFPYVSPEPVLINHRVSSSGKKGKRQRASLTARQAVRAAPQADTAEDRRGNHHHQRAQVRDEAAQLAAACEKRTLFSQLFLCLSRACLDKRSFSKHQMAQKRRFSHRSQRRWPRLSRAARKRSVFEFSLCLSRACLGKMIILIYKWLKKTAFSPASQHVLWSQRSSLMRFQKQKNNDDSERPLFV